MVSKQALVDILNDLFHAERPEDVPPVLSKLGLDFTQARIVLSDEKPVSALDEKRTMDAKYVLLQAELHSMMEDSVRTIATPPQTMRQR